MEAKSKAWNSPKIPWRSFIYFLIMYRNEIEREMDIKYGDLMAKELKKRQEKTKS
jgi:hypothetical protein